MKKEIQRAVTIKICDYCNKEIDRDKGYDWFEPYDFHKECTKASAVSFVKSRESRKVPDRLTVNINGKEVEFNPDTGL